MYDVRMAEKANLFLRLETGNNERPISVMLRNLRNPASPEGVMEIVQTIKPILEYSIKRVEMMLQVEYIEV